MRELKCERERERERERVEKHQRIINTKGAKNFCVVLAYLLWL
jgi:hypothetical protein